jgi:SAM-dependent methyltransferase
VTPPEADRPVGILSEVADYYSTKLAEHGETALGVDWNGEESQALRFKQLARIIEEPQGFAINDLGCGYAALLDWLEPRFKGFRYFGYDVSEHMIGAAQGRYAGHAEASFCVASAPTEIADYGIASGIFNVRLERSDAEWQDYLERTVDVLDRTSRRGFGFNCLTSYSDAEKMRNYLYYANPSALFDLCKRRYSRNVALLHDYGLYEFTILVRKNL